MFSRIVVVTNGIDDNATPKIIIQVVVLLNYNNSPMTFGA